MSFLDKIFKKEEVKKEEKQENIENTNEIFKLTENEVLNTYSQELVKKFKHNLQVLVNEAKEKNKITKFAIIRDEDFIPDDYIWKVSSKNTRLEKQLIPLTQELKNRYALEKYNLKYNQNGLSIPILNDKSDKRFQNIDSEKFKINVPITFCSTKHFSVNAPFQGIKNNSLSNNKMFTIIDGMKFFINSGYVYSISYNDSYIDVSHIGLKISKSAIILMEKNKYDSIIDKQLIEHLRQRKLILYEGRLDVAINMVLTEIGILPSKIDSEYFEYNNEIKDILEKSIQSLALQNNLTYDNNNYLYKKISHFSSYYDSKNNDYNESINNFVKFLKEKLPDLKDLITDSTIKDFNASNKLIDSVGVDKLLSIISEYNDLTKKEFEINYLNYKNDRKNIDLTINNTFKSTNNLIDLYYKDKDNIDISDEIKKQIEDNIILFMQGNTVNEQIEACKKISSIFTKIYN